MLPLVSALQAELEIIDDSRDLKAAMVKSDLTCSSLAAVQQSRCGRDAVCRYTHCLPEEKIP